MPDPMWRSIAEDLRLKILTRFEGGKAGNYDDRNRATPPDAVPHEVRTRTLRQAQGRARPKASAGDSDVKSA